LEYNSLINEKTPQQPQSTRGGERGSPQHILPVTHPQRTRHCGPVAESFFVNFQISSVKLEIDWLILPSGRLHKLLKLVLQVSNPIICCKTKTVF